MNLPTSETPHLELLKTTIEEELTFYRGRTNGRLLMNSIQKPKSITDIIKIRIDAFCVLSGPWRNTHRANKTICSSADATRLVVLDLS